MEEEKRKTPAELWNTQADKMSQILLSFGRFCFKKPGKDKTKNIGASSDFLGFLWAASVSFELL